MERIRSILTQERGSAVLLALGFLIFLLAMGGIAIDVAYMETATGELQRSMEAAALAGAGKLGFNDTVFPAVRDAAVQYAGLNPYHLAPTAPAPPPFGRNDANAPTGNVVLGIWDAGAFTPSVDGNIVNAVRCQYASTVPTSFLRVIGFQSLPISAQAIAIANPPRNPPPTGCMFPIGLSSCFFNPNNSSVGCGAMVSFISSSNNSAVGANSSAWVSMYPTCATANGGQCSDNVNTPATSAAIDGAAGLNGATCQTSTLENQVSQVATTNGMAAAVYNNHLIPDFIQKYNASPTYTVMGPDGSTPTYTGKGWQVYVPVIDTGTTCPPGAITGALSVVGFSRFVITQVRNNNGECAVANHSPNNPWDSKCFLDKNGTATSLSPGDTGSRGIYGYYDCTYIQGPPVPTPSPRTALATRLRLVNTAPMY